jgi:hypothetical protein
MKLLWLFGVTGTKLKLMMLESWPIKRDTYFVVLVSVFVYLEHGVFIPFYACNIC